MRTTGVIPDASAARIRSSVRLQSLEVNIWSIITQWNPTNAQSSTMSALFAKTPMEVFRSWILSRSGFSAATVTSQIPLADSIGMLYHFVLEPKGTQHTANLRRTGW
jgi:uncharacterized protein YaiI (UPF0178 family)